MAGDVGRVVGEVSTILCLNNLTLSHHREAMMLPMFLVINAVTQAADNKKFTTV